MKFFAYVLCAFAALPKAAAFVPSSKGMTTTTTTTTTATTIGSRVVKVARTYPTVIGVSSSSSSDDETSSSRDSGLDLSFVKDAVERAKQELPKFDASQVQQNLQQGELGQRGEVYFIAQALLVVAIVLGGIPLVGDPLRVILSPVLLLGGGAIALLSVVDLGSDSLSPFPKPTAKGSLKTTGLYGQMRHPMYTSLLSVMLGLAMATDSIDRLLLTGLLWYILEIKTEKEEAFLMEMYGEEYAAYQDTVPQKFLPMGLVEILPWTE